MKSSLIALLFTISLITCLGKEFSRALTTDRPDQTESPNTVENGVIQIEVDAVSFSSDKKNPDHSSTTVTSYSIAATNIRFGVTQDLELNFIFEPYIEVETKNRTTKASHSISGSGDLTLRAKYNFWGNDGGKTAFAILPYLKIPTSSGNIGNDYLEGGVIIPYGIELADGLGLGLQTGLDFVRNDSGSNSKYSTELILSAALGIDLNDRWGMYIESFNTLKTNGGSDCVASYFDLGATYAINEDTQLDIGANWGLTRAAEDFTIFLGITVRR